MTGGHSPSLAGASWLTRPETQHVLAAIASEGFDARIVGGAVRNALLARPVADIDIATTAEPDDVVRLASAAGLDTVPTGIAHGTITVIANHVPYEVTTLRRDISTDGRRATVAFTTDWAEDARRRDFTINALYCDRRGAVFDPLGGLGDLASARVRFIGDPIERLREDRLRILRFFRFSAEYAKGAFDVAGLDACTLEKSGIAQLSGERLRSELLRLMLTPRVLEALTLMQERGILGEITGGAADLTSVARLIALEATTKTKPSPIRRLATLTVGARADADRVTQRLRLSSVEAAELSLALSDPRPFSPVAPELDARAFLYRHGSAAFIGSALIAWARSQDAATDPKRHTRLCLPERWQAPDLPVRGADILDLGVPPGPEIGRILASFETWWVAENFPSDKTRIDAKLRQLALGY